jgi:Fur family ferric uptake transcriptional regulator
MESQQPSTPSTDDIAITMPLCSVFRRFLKSRDLKYTPERADILDAIIQRDDMFEAEDLLLALRDKGYRVSKATIYRTIKLLQEAGIITQALFDSRQAHYQLIFGRKPRDMMVCMKTGRQVQIESPDLLELRDRICARYGWKPMAHRLQIYAISPDAKDH